METKTEAFTIRVGIGERNYRLDIVRGCDGRDLPSYYTLGEGPVVKGVIHQMVTGGWEWIEGGFMQQDANFIGSAIDEFLVGALQA